jgi:hypothetical protein
VTILHKALTGLLAVFVLALGAFTVGLGVLEVHFMAHPDNLVNVLGG